MQNAKCKMQNEMRYSGNGPAIFISFIIAFLFIAFGLLAPDHSPQTTVQADTTAPKSTGMSAAPELAKTNDKELRLVLERTLREHAVIIDWIYRRLRDDIDLINEIIPDSGAAATSYGSCYGNGIEWWVTHAPNAVPLGWYNIADSHWESYISDGPSDGVLHDGRGKLTVSSAGYYLVCYSLSLQAEEDSADLYAGIEVNGSGTAEAAGRSYFGTISAYEIDNFSSSAILTLADDDYVELAVYFENDESDSPLLVEEFHLNVIKLGI